MPFAFYIRFVSEWHSRIRACSHRFLTLKAKDIIKISENRFEVWLPQAIFLLDHQIAFAAQKPTHPVFIWGAPGIGKSALVQKFADDVGMECVSLLGSQLAPEDIIGIPQIKGETSQFMPPKMIARKEPYVLFLDELNACSQEVQKAFYSLIHERRIGEYHLPKGSVVIGAGNRSQDGAIVKTMSSALINRMFHVQLVADPNQWLNWAYDNDIHPTCSLSFCADSRRT